MAKIRYIDLSHTIEDGMITYKGLPAPVICDFLSREDSRQHYEEGTEFQIGRIDMVSNTGTYLDSPFHRYADGKDLSELPLNSLAQMEGILVDASQARDRAIGVSFFRGKALKDKAVLVRTGWDRHWRSDQYFEDNPFLTEEAARYLVQAGVRLVGIDSVNIDDMMTRSRPVHTLLLGAEIPIVEHMCNLHELPAKTFGFSAVPPKIKQFGTFPVRAYAWVSDEL